MGKVKQFLAKNKKKVVMLMTVMMLTLAMSSLCFATEGAGATPDLTPITGALTEAITPDAIVDIIASLIGYSMPFVLMWFAYRFLKRAFIKAVMAGRL